ncbi:hypothetical protein ACLOJK_024392 [Asimina triloba]
MGRQPWLPPLPPPVKPHTPTPTATVRSRRRHHTAEVATTTPTATVAIDSAVRPPVIFIINTHHRRVSRRTIRAIHHEEDDAHIPDLLRAQTDADHSGHTRRVFLARHQQLQFNPAPIPSNLPKLVVAIFSSSTSRSSCWPPSPSSAITPTSQHVATATASPA